MTSMRGIVINSSYLFEDYSGLRSGKEGQACVLAATRLLCSGDEHDGRKPCGITLRNPSVRVIQRIDRRVTCARRSIYHCGRDG